MRANTARLPRIAGALLALALVASACGGTDGDASNDRAGGAGLTESTVLTFAQPNDDAPPPQLVRWAEAVSRLSEGTLEIEFANGWRIGEVEYEAGTVQDVQAGDVDMAWVGARVFDTLGLDSFQPLLAPMLVDSYDLQGAVFEAGIPQQMLAGMASIDLVGIGVLPGPMRKVLGVDKPFLRASDFEGAVIGLQDSAVAELSLLAVGATPQPVPSGASLDGLDGYEQQISSIAGNNYPLFAGYVTGNVNLWPRPLVIITNTDVFGSLTEEQQAALRDAASEAIPAALEDSRAEDESALPFLCGRGMALAVADDAELADLRATLEPVYTELADDPVTKAHIDAIIALKTDLAAPPESLECTGASPLAEPPAAPVEATAIDGTWAASFTRDELLAAGLLDAGEDNNGNWGDMVVTLDRGSLKWDTTNTMLSETATGEYEVDGDAVLLAWYGEALACRWSIFRDTLTFTRDESLGVCPTPLIVKPWRLVKSDDGAR